MDKTEIYHYLKEQKIEHEITEHKVVFNMDEMDSVELPYHTSRRLECNER